MDVTESQFSAIAENLSEIIEKRGYVYIKANGDSMNPWIKPGSILRVERFNRDHQTGSIVLLNQKSTFLIHRVINQNNNCILTKGDNLLCNDGPCEETKIIGSVSEITFPNGSKYSLSENQLPTSTIVKISRVTNVCYMASRDFALQLETWSGKVISPIIYRTIFQVASPFIVLRISRVLQTFLRFHYLIKQKVVFVNGK